MSRGLMVPSGKTKSAVASRSSALGMVGRTLARILLTAAFFSRRGFGL